VGGKDKTETKDGNIKSFQPSSYQPNDMLENKSHLSKLLHGGWKTRKQEYCSVEGHIHRGFLQVQISQEKAGTT
jgi:hypothetical protein